MGDRRPLLYSPQFIEACALRAGYVDLVEMHSRNLAELADLRRELAELRDILGIVVKASRETAERDVAALRHQLEVALARVERDPNKPLH